MSFIKPDKTKIVNEYLLSQPGVEPGPLGSNPDVLPTELSRTDEYLQKSTSKEISWEQNERTNPWNVTNVSAFLFYCCPECDNYREINKEVFIQHAVSIHEKVSKITKNV